MDLNYLWTQHVQTEDVPWVQVDPLVEARILQVRPQDSLVAYQQRFQPGYKYQLHRHTGMVFGLTTRGAWGHKPDDLCYTKGVYLFEPAGVVHAFFNGPEISEAIFIVLGEVQDLDPETKEVVRTSSAGAFLDEYFTLCEKQGKPRPNILI